MKLTSKKWLPVSVLALVVMATAACPKAYAVMPPSTVMEKEQETLSDGQRLAGIIQKLKDHEKENQNFLKTVERELKELQG